MNRRLTARLTLAAMASTPLVLLPALSSTAALPPQCSTAGVDVTCVFAGASGSTYSLAIPNAVTSMQVRAVGQRGANANGAQGGLGAVVDGIVPTQDGDVFSIQLRNDGGSGGSGGGGAGGDSVAVVRQGSAVPAVQAAGGGGGGNQLGSFGGNGGNAGQAGQAGGSSSPSPATGGGPGSLSAGGNGGSGAWVDSFGCFNPSPQPSGGSGGAGLGGAGGSASTGPAGGGGGGGGRFGGGGGGAGGSGCIYQGGGAGGGGGSSLVPAGGTQGVSGESPHVRITFKLRPRATYAPGAVAFGNVELGRTSATTLVTVNNTGSAPMAMGSATLTGTGASAFGKASDTCTGTAVPVGGSCQVGVRFSPVQTGDFQATLSIADNSPTTPHTVALSGTGIPPGDLKLLGIGSIYTGKNHLVTRAVAPGGTMSYKVGVLNEDVVPRSYKLRLTKSASPANATVWTTGLGAKALPTDGSGNFVTPPVAAGKVATFVLKVTPTVPAQTISRIDVDLLTDTGALIEGLDTETNTPAPAVGSSSFELFAKQGSQPFTGGPVDGQTATGPALNVGQSANYTVRLRNDGTAAARIGLKVTDVDGCAGSFTTAVKVGIKAWTAEAFAGTYQTPVLAPGKYVTVTVAVKRAAAGCPAHKLSVQSLDGSSAVRTSYLLANASYNAATD